MHRSKKVICLGGLAALFLGAVAVFVAPYLWTWGEDINGLSRRVRTGPFSDHAWKKLVNVANQGNPEAQYAVACLYQWEFHDSGQYVTWARRAAENGDEVAQASVAALLENAALQDEQRNHEAVAWIRRWANDGKQWAESRLALLYSKGRLGLSRDFGESLTWFRRSLYTHSRMPVQENVNDYAEIGDMYRIGGHGIERDVARAYVSYRVALTLNKDRHRIIPNPVPHVEALRKQLSPHHLSACEKMAADEITGDHVVLGGN
jgi:hypothetical protein